MDPRALLTFSRSEPDQGLLEGLLCGAAIPLIRLRELPTLAVPVPSREEAQRFIEAFKRQASDQADIDRLMKEQTQPPAARWA